MLSKLTKYQEKLLTALIELYEKSKTYEGTNQVNQSFSRLPSQIFKEYESDFTDCDLVQDFENQMRELEEEGLIIINWNQNVIKKLYANTSEWEIYNTILKRKDKNVLIREELLFYQDSIGCHDWIDAFCREQIERLQSGKKAAYSLEDAKVIVKLATMILENEEELLERELSILCFGDSKKFEKSYRSRVCSWMKKYGDFDALLDGIDDKREAEQVILAEYNISANPSYVYFKGPAELKFDNGNNFTLQSSYPIALSSVALEHLEKIEIRAGAVMTIENLTSFNRINDGNCFFIFLSGYHNTAKQRFLREIYDQNCVTEWMHFGDLDPDGLYILERLRSRTGIPFRLFHMSIEDLKKYKKYSKPLESNDRTKANSLINSGLHTELMEFMLEEGIKLEQEIISLELSK